MNISEIVQIPLAPENCVMGFGRTIIVAPHADDESLGCGGVIALLRKFNLPVHILLLTDGTLSHPNSTEYPSDKLRDLREEEIIEAAKCLDVTPENLIFCRYKDRQLPDQDSEDFESAVKNISKIFEILKPQSVFVPWRRDPHPDHRSAYNLIKKANENAAKLYEYPIWLKELGESGDTPTSEEVMPFRLDISSVLNQKIEAISAHKSQITDLINDDPNGFRISEEMLNDFNVPYETFYISK